MAEDSLTTIERAQERWALDRHLPFSRPGYVAELRHNLYLGTLSQSAEAQFRAGDGAELTGSGSRPPKMCSLISSSALAVNSFDYWSDRNREPLQAALKLSRPITSLRFEYKCRDYPVSPRSPNLDLMLTCDDGSRLAIESKFTEPFRSKGSGQLLSSKYFAKGPLWERAGMPRAQRLANELKPHWKHLDVAQLLKHMLGIASEKDVWPTRLLYLWYDPSTQEAEEHRVEAGAFASALGDSPVAFGTMSYNELYAGLAGVVGPDDSGYITYIHQRYLSAVV